MTLLKHNVPGYEIYQPTSGGKAGKGHAKTSSIQVRHNNQLLTLFRYKVGDSESRALAIRNAKEYAENHYLANQPKPEPKPTPEQRATSLRAEFGYGTFKQKLLEQIDFLAIEHHLNWFDAVEESLQVLAHMMSNAFRSDNAVNKLYEQAKRDAHEELLRKLKE